GAFDSLTVVGECEVSVGSFIVQSFGPFFAVGDGSLEPCNECVVDPSLFFLIFPHVFGSFDLKPEPPEPAQNVISDTEVKDSQTGGIFIPGCCCDLLIQFVTLGEGFFEIGLISL